MERLLRDILFDTLNRTDLVYVQDAVIKRVIFYKETNELDIFVTMENIVPIHIIDELNSFFEHKFNTNVNVHIEYLNEKIKSSELLGYYYNYLRKNNLKKIYKDNIPVIVNDKIVFKLENIQDLDNIKNDYQNLINYLKSYYLNFDLDYELIEVKKEDNFEVYQDFVVYEKEPVKEEKKQRQRYEYLNVRIKDLEEPVDNVIIVAEVFKIDNIKTKHNRIIQNLYIVDETGACLAQRFENKTVKIEDIESIKVNQRYKIKGDYIRDNYTGNNKLSIKKIEVKEKEVDKVIDNEPIKRIEFHAHSNKSDMDGVSSVESIVERAFEFGHKAVAITDHGCVQAFPRAKSTVESLLKKHPDREFKMIYGVEMNLVPKNQTIVINPNDTLIKDIEYVFFDVETTGLSAKYDHIIEFAGTVIKNNQVIDTLNIFIKPPISIPSNITNLTNISDDTVKNAKSFKEEAERILTFLNNRVLVAHNAKFDYDFINGELIRINKPLINNPTIDTLALSRNYINGKRSYNLGSMASHFKIPYHKDDAHRADYDVKILIDIYNNLKLLAFDQGVNTLNELQNNQGFDAFSKEFSKHIICIAKNQAGIKDLYKLVTLSNTKYLSVLSKTKSDDSDASNNAEGRIIKEELNNLRENILIGSACLNGEIFELAMNKGDQALIDAMKFYDYIEVQPIENYSPFLIKELVPDTSRLEMVVKRIIDTANLLQIPVIATGDVHYVNKDEKFIRDIYIQTKGIGGSRHPLYLRDSYKRRRYDSPNQHFKSTTEMLEDFSWLNNDKLIYDIVITNPNDILKKIEVAYPIPKKLYTPVIEGSDDKLREICYENAHALYGTPLPHEVEERLNRELESIIGNGYGVIYYISHLLVKKSNEAGYLVGSRGSVGSSFAATMSGITEVNPLAPHYICKSCHNLLWQDPKEVISGYDLPTKICDKCGDTMIGEGQNIPFETFLGFKGDKVPDIDLNFSGEYQPQAHAFTKEVFGKDNVFRAGTISTVQEKTAFGYIKNYTEEKQIPSYTNTYISYLATRCEGVKRTTGQHPGGIIVIPNYKDVYDFTPVQYPANNPESEWRTTHFDFHEIHDNVLKLDILGHVDPTVMRFLHNISGIDPRTISMNDEKALSLFNSTEHLNLVNKEYEAVTGALGLPEFGTGFVRGMLETTKPRLFSELVCLSGLSHGTDVWLNNAEDLIKQGNTLHQVIGCRDDIMSDLIKYGLENKSAFDIMESVRKGKGLKPEWKTLMKENNVPEWFIDSCEKIKYMFPKAHAVAYVTMAVRVAWFKVYYPEYYYAAYFSKRCDSYEIETMIKDYKAISNRLQELKSMVSNRTATNKEVNLIVVLENCYEMVSRGYRIANVNMELSLANDFRVNPNNNKEIIAPFIVIDGLGSSVAESIVEARKEQEFRSIEDVIKRTSLSKKLIEKLKILGCLSYLKETDQYTLF